MKQLKSVTLMLALFGLVWTGMNGQEVFPAAGNDAFGNGGSASYSVGQVAFNTYTTPAGSLAEGVQQPYEISIIIGIGESEKIKSRFTVFPNPASTHLQLEIPEQNVNQVSYRLYNTEGKLLLNEQIRSLSTQILVGSLPPATYFLKLVEDDKEIQTFKIIKN